LTNNPALNIARKISTPQLINPQSDRNSIQSRKRIINLKVSKKENETIAKRLQRNSTASSALNSKTPAIKLQKLDLDRNFIAFLL